MDKCRRLYNSALNIPPKLRTKFVRSKPWITFGGLSGAVVSRQHGVRGRRFRGLWGRDDPVLARIPSTAPPPGRPDVQLRVHDRGDGTSTNQARLLRCQVAAPGAYPTKSYKYWFTNICHLHILHFCHLSINVGSVVGQFFQTFWANFMKNTCKIGSPKFVKKVGFFLRLDFYKNRPQGIFFCKLCYIWPKWNAVREPKLIFKNGLQVGIERTRNLEALALPPNGKM
jgi:hypothetical protein